MKRIVRCSLVLFLLSPLPSFAANAIGKVDHIQGESSGVADGSTKPLTLDAAVFENEEITTGPDARLALRFDDGTLLTIGEKARVLLDEFIYRPEAESRLRLAVVGAFRFVSGNLRPGATRDASVTTPVATIGVRGTDFWGGPIDGHFGVVLIDGAITVSTSAGSVEVNAPNQGVDMTDGASPPGPVHDWARAKIDRAIDTVTFR
jgi:hypothetical protein